MRLIEGDVVPDLDPEVERLRARIRVLERDKADAELAATRAREDADRALRMLRQQLSPLYRALQAVFGELDAVGVADTPLTSTGSSPSNDASKWDAWKTRLGSNCARVIDVLLLGGEMTVTAISVGARMGKRQVYEATSKMGQAGILTRNGSKFSLKQ